MKKRQRKGGVKKGGRLRVRKTERKRKMEEGRQRRKGEAEEGN